MGNDGGSIPDRRDLVRTKKKGEQADKANQTRAKWAFCALSKLPLQEPVVSCALGKLYNKDAVLEYLLDKGAFGDGQNICGHIRSLKDVKTLKLTANPAPAREASTSVITPDRAQFVCPLTLKEMNGVQPFSYILSCGCAFSQAGLKAVSSGSSPKDSDTMDSLSLCPQCGAKYNASSDIIQLNPSLEEETKMLEDLVLRRAQEPTKKSKKRKAAELDGADSKKKKTSTSAPSLNPSITTASRTVVNSLAQEEAKRKAGMSDAVKSLYRDKDAPERKEGANFMTRTFNRYA
ncbi:DUF602-domain-containing protein [Pterulicium gracile]|uniref:DUF602-domain-containing protein n=1 Tax=Pterulicium gracile TaxID=1884261 RepID=A0A5C3QZ08_9AGAR|nr:DUF602-domain-containing protein [Pterula gracilis]